MARVVAPVWYVSVLFTDNNNKSASTGFALPGALTYEDASARAITIVQDMDDVSDARIDSWQISRAFREDSPVSPPSTSEVQRKLRLSFDAGQFRNAAEIEVPSHIFDLEQPGNDFPDPANAAYADLVTNLTQGSIGPGNGIVTWTGLDVTRLNSAELVHRNRKSDKR